MNSEQYNSSNTPGNTSHGSGFLTPDAGPDTARADYSDAGTPDILQPNVNDSREQADLNDSRHDNQNVDASNPEPFDDDQDTNVVNRQLGIISRVSG